MITLIVCLILNLICLSAANEVDVLIVPPKPDYHPIYSRWHAGECECEECSWIHFKRESVNEHADQFTAMFNAIEFKRAKNGASMIRCPGDKSFRFVKKG